MDFQKHIYYPYFIFNSSESEPHHFTSARLDGELALANGSE